MADYMIIEEMEKRGDLKKYDPRHIEGYIRTAHQSLNYLSRSRLKKEIDIAKACIDRVGIEDAENLAKSFGL